MSVKPKQICAILFRKEESEDNCRVLICTLCEQRSKVVKLKSPSGYQNQMQHLEGSEHKREWEDAFKAQLPKEEGGGGPLTCF